MTPARRSVAPLFLPLMPPPERPPTAHAHAPRADTTCVLPHHSAPQLLHYLFGSFAPHTPTLHRMTPCVTSSPRCLSPPHPPRRRRCDRPRTACRRHLPASPPPPPRPDAAAAQVSPHKNIAAPKEYLRCISILSSRMCDKGWSRIHSIVILFSTDKDVRI